MGRGAAWTLRSILQLSESNQPMVNNCRSKWKRACVNGLTLGVLAAVAFLAVLYLGPGSFSPASAVGDTVATPSLGETLTSDFLSVNKATPAPVAGGAAKDRTGHKADGGDGVVTLLRDWTYTRQPSAFN
jgi:hypothetical protein